MRTSNRLGCLSGTGLMAAIVTSLLIVGYVYAKGGLLYNPGPLNTQRGDALGGVSSHADIGGDCNACHAAPWESATMADRCVACHTEIGAQMMAVATVHGSMMHDNPELTCRHCHTEHRGADSMLTEMNDAEFPHELVGFSLKAHQTTVKKEAFVCSDCHGDDISTFDLQMCTTCHSEMDGAFTSDHVLEYGTACLNCHEGVDFFGDVFTHNKYSFALTGKHTNLSCAKCHNGANEISDFSALPQDCYSCHQNVDAHGGRFGTDCAACHGTDGWLPAKFDHNLSDFKLVGEHTEAQCDECHVNNVYQGTPTDCFSCHKRDDEHNGRFGTECSTCHSPQDWEELTFDHRQAFALTGKHVDVPCEKCHQDFQFAGVSRTCAGCHGDPTFHAGMFGLDCLACHTTNNWFARYTGPHPGIADEGGSGVNHGGASCRDCHTQTLRTATCDSCHRGGNFEDGGDGGGDGGDDD